MTSTQAPTALARTVLGSANSPSADSYPQPHDLDCHVLATFDVNSLIYVAESATAHFARKLEAPSTRGTRAHTEVLADPVWATSRPAGCNYTR
eukprot:CAMPEP_0118895554 /NCGR_PEP_ID=MMETSP1166-20130328/3857_1 /TAXON_ID=1104430 /ORGANISM="Chrysoreinhardia sp, Strain CCMP3193" /LENGTH=92 /DNA_ID=CAMNT_0006834599 /DNA_START=1561 /DNA_END=1837 /DNA_ORIENTATION=-